MDGLYDSRALTLDGWADQSSTMQALGWRHLPVKGGVVYARKLLEGEPNLASPDWICGLDQVDQACGKAIDKPSDTGV